MIGRLDREQRYHARELAEIYRKPHRYSSTYKQNLYEIAAHEPVIHFEALKINKSRRYHKVIRG